MSGTPQNAETAQRWVFGDEVACRYLASVSWPWEREENRDAWAVTMLHRPDLLAKEIERAHARLNSAIEHLTSLVTPPDCTCRAGNGLPFPAQHATLCPRFSCGRTDVLKPPGSRSTTGGPE